MNYAGLDMTQINNGLEQTAACASAVAYDKANGLVFVSYMTGVPKRYGESNGRICLSVFSPSQPHNVRHRNIDNLEGRSRGFLCCANHLAGNKRVRIFFTDYSEWLDKDKPEEDRTFTCPVSVYYRDYDFASDTVSDRVEVLLRTDEGDVRINPENYCRYVGGLGYEVTHMAPPIINKITSYQGELYTAVTTDTGRYSYAILCKIEDNILVPFAICPEKLTYEFRYFVNDDGIFAAFRKAPDDHEINHGGYTYSKDGGKTWNTTIYADGVQSRPDMIEYLGKPLYIYNYKSDKSIEHFPLMHNSRNALKFVYDGEVVLDLFSKYGFVEHDSISILDDLYMAFSNCPQALSTENRSAWRENGSAVEQGKETIQWVKLGNILAAR